MPPLPGQARWTATNIQSSGTSVVTRVATASARYAVRDTRSLPTRAHATPLTRRAQRRAADAPTPFQKRGETLDQAASPAPDLETTPEVGQNLSKTPHRLFPEGGPK
jgi:hypothetical protein